MIPIEDQVIDKDTLDKLDIGNTKSFTTTIARIMKCNTSITTNVNTSQQERMHSKVQKESAHEGVRYSWNKYEYTVTENKGLKKHDVSKHDMSNPGGVRYGCAQCDYQAARPCILYMRVSDFPAHCVIFQQLKGKS